MARRIETDYPDDVEIGTRADDGRLGPESLYILTTGDKEDMRVLSKKQALAVASAILETVGDLS